MARTEDTASVRLPQAAVGAAARPTPLPERVFGGGTGRPPARSLYIHTPFCVHKCHYCDFYSFVDTRDQQEAFVDRLIDELRAISPHAGPLRTIFVGGGTPSLLRIELWERLLSALDDLFDLGALRVPWRPEHDDPWREVKCAEFTVECNPESASAELMGVLRAGGVNRVSIGAQSFESRHLRTLERRHDPENVARAIQHARAAGIARQSVDLIYAIPDQTLDEWDADLRRAVALGTTHLSCYALTYEPGTAMTARLARGDFAGAPEELESEMFAHTTRTLGGPGGEAGEGGAGLARYEVSNFARPGHESRHNLAYWVQEQWLAAGPSASGHILGGPSLRDGSWRYKNVPRLGDYLASTGHSPVVDAEPPDPARLLRERVMMGLRLGMGLEVTPLLEDAAAICGEGSTRRLVREAQRCGERGEMTMQGSRWTLTDAGFLHCDGIAARLMRTLDHAS